MAVIPLTSALALMDNVARTLLDLEAAFLANPVTATPSVATITAGQTGASNSLASRISGLTDLTQQAALGSAALQDAGNIIGYMNISVTGIYILYRDFMNALDLHTGGVDDYLTANAAQVHPEFANCFNFVANNAPLLGVRTATFTPISIANIFVPVNQTLGTIGVTGAASGTFTVGTAVDTTQYSPAALTLRNIKGGLSAGTATQFSVTYVNASGSSATASFSLGRALADGESIAINAIGSSVSAISVVSGGVNGDSFAVIAAPMRIVTY